MVDSINEKSGNKNNITALFWLTKDMPVLPIRAIFALGLLIILVITTVFIIDRFIGVFGAKGYIAIKAWEHQDKIILQENNRKKLHKDPITKSFDPVFLTAGMPSREIKVDRKRILVLGDSFIWGDGSVNSNMIWWRQLQWELERRGYWDVDIIAAGLNGYSTQDQYNLIIRNQIFEKLKPDFVIFGYVTNDADMKLDTGEHLVKRLSLSGWAGITDSIFGKIFPNLSYAIDMRMRRKEEHINSNEENGYAYPLWEEKILEGENFSQYKNLLEKLSCALNKNGVSYIFVTTPHSPDQSLQRLYEPVQNAYDEMGIDFIDLLPGFIQYSINKSLENMRWGVNPVNSHPGPVAAHYYAVQVADILENRFSDKLGMKATVSPPVDADINDWFPEALKVQQISEHEWLFDYPANKQQLLFLPLETPYVSLNFARPVSINSLTLTNKFQSKCKIWLKSLDDIEDYEVEESVFLGAKSGDELNYLLNDTVRIKRITSILISCQHDNFANHDTDSLAPDGSNSIRLKIAFGPDIIKL